MALIWRTLPSGFVEVDHGNGFVRPTVASDENTARVTSWLPLARTAARRHEAPLPWVLGVMYAESYGRHEVKSHVGAVGLMQIMPSTAALYGVKAADLPRPDVNVDLGARVLAELRDGGRFDLPSVASMYNAGPRKLGGPKTSTKSPWGFVEDPGYISRVVAGTNFFFGRHGGSTALAVGACVLLGAAAWRFRS